MPHLYSLKITQQKRGDLAFLHIYMFSLSQLIGRSFGKWTGILRSWFSTCRESLFDYSGAKCFWKRKSNILLWWCYLGRWQSIKICMGCRLIMFFLQEVRVNNGPQSIRVKHSLMFYSCMEKRIKTTNLAW